MPGVAVCGLLHSAYRNRNDFVIFISRNVSGRLRAERVGFEPTDRLAPINALAGRPDQPDSGTSPDVAAHCSGQPDHARRERDSNPRDSRPKVFKTSAFGRSAIPPPATLLLSGSRSCPCADRPTTHLPSATPRPPHGEPTRRAHRQRDTNRGTSRPRPSP